MTGSDDSHSNTRPISVAELLAKNGSIGAPPVGGRRRRRRRGNADAVSVAELTGEIPIIRLDDPDPSVATAAVEDQVEEVDAGTVPAIDSAADDLDDVTIPEVPEPDTAEVPEPDTAEVPEPDSAEVPEPDGAEVPEGSEQKTAEVPEAESEEAVAEAPDSGDDAGDDVDDDYADAVAEYAAHLEHRGDDADPADSVPPPPPRRFGFGRKSRKKAKKSQEPLEPQEPQGSDEPVTADAEKMSPDPSGGDEIDLVDSPAVAAIDIVDLDIESLDDQVAPDAEDSDELPSYLRSTQEPLFGGQTVADDLARRETSPVPGEIDLGEVDLGETDDLADEELAEYGEPRRMSSFVHGLWIVGQSVIAVMFGAGLFVAFDQLWKWNNIVALVLSVLVILGLVVAVRVVRKTEDIGSTLIAVAVGALVTLGPLALLQSG